MYSRRLLLASDQSFSPQFKRRFVPGCILPKPRSPQSSVPASKEDEKRYPKDQDASASACSAATSEGYALVAFHLLGVP